MKKILLIDEDERYLSSMQLMLEHNGYTVTCATDARQAYSAATDSLYNLVVSNVMVPYASGYELLVNLKNMFQKLWKKIPMLVVSEINNEVTISDCKRIGVEDYMVKPVVLPEMIDRIKLIVNQHAPG